MPKYKCNICNREKQIHHYLSVIDEECVFSNICRLCKKKGFDKFDYKNYRKCNRCDNVKKNDEFGRYGPWCSECSKEYRSDYYKTIGKLKKNDTFNKFTVNFN